MQNIIIYPGVIFEVQPLLLHLAPKKIFLVTGKKSFLECGAHHKLKWLFENHEVIHFNNFKTNPDSDDVENGVKLFNQEHCDLIMSIGGGSVIDLAKLVNYYYNAGSNKIDEENINNSKFAPVKHICLPTTAGSGSESTQFAVMYIGSIKFSIAHPNLTPNFVFIDPELHYSQNSYQKAASGMDALAQAIESFWSIQSTQESRLYSEKALELVWKNLPKAVHQGEKAAHLKLAIGSNLAGRAINIAKTTAPHALAYGFTKKLGLPHGHAVALTLSSFFEFNLRYTNEESSLFEIKRKILEILNGESVYDGKSKLEQFISRLDLETKISKIGPFDKKELLSIIDNVNIQRLSNNPIPVYTSDLIKIINDIF